MAKKLHWTQTPEGKAKLAARRNRKESSDGQEEGHIIYALGRTEEWLGVYADSLGLPRTLVTSRVGELLQRKTCRSRVGS
jgi:hypothetical protein